jgi:hypothetical protein
MTNLGVQDAAAKADHMVNPASLATSMIDERAPDIAEPSTTCLRNSRSPFCFTCRPIALLKSSTSGAGTQTRTRHADAAGSSRKAACRRVGRPRRRHLPPGQGAALLGAPVNCSVRLAPYWAAATMCPAMLHGLCGDSPPSLSSTGGAQLHGQTGASVADLFRIILPISPALVASPFCVTGCSFRSNSSLTSAPRQAREVAQDEQVDCGWTRAASPGQDKDPLGAFRKISGDQIIGAPAAAEVHLGSGGTYHITIRIERAQETRFIGVSVRLKSP